MRNATRDVEYGRASPQDDHTVVKLGGGVRTLQVAHSGTKPLPTGLVTSTSKGTSHQNLRTRSIFVLSSAYATVV